MPARGPAEGWPLPILKEEVGKLTWGISSCQGQQPRQRRWQESREPSSLYHLGPAWESQLPPSAPGPFPSHTQRLTCPHLSTRPRGWLLSGALFEGKDASVSSWELGLRQGW